jgi:hypothetical protein
MKQLRGGLYLVVLLIAGPFSFPAHAESPNTSSCADRELVESGKLSGEGKSVGFVVGARWGQGVVTMNDGTKFKFKAKGGKGWEFGAAAAKYSGTVFNLSTPADFNGNFSGMTTATTVGKAGIGRSHLTNGKCVVVKLRRHDQEGLQTSAPMLGVIHVEVVE